MVISITASHPFPHLCFSQNLHYILREEITMTKPDSYNSHGESIFCDQLRSGTAQATKLGLGRQKEVSERIIKKKVNADIQQ